MLAKSTADSFSDQNWLFEIKWDGYRAIAEVLNDNVKLYSRNGNSFIDAYPVIAKQLQKLSISAVLDGEIVVMDENGNPNFQKLQNYVDNIHLWLAYYVFDLLELKGEKLYDQPLIKRKHLLANLLGDDPVIKYSDHVNEAGEAFFKVVSEKGLEGMMAKKMDSLYYPGKRTNEWLKIKVHNTDEAVIAGFTQPRGGRKYFGSLVLGMMKGGRLHYVGHTGSGFNEQLLSDLHNKLLPLQQEQSPFEEKVKTNMPVTWVKPMYVCEVKFAEFTSDGIMRHPIFLRLRPDKKSVDTELTSDKTVVMKESNSSEKKSAEKSRSKKQEDLDTSLKDKVYTIGRSNVATTNRTKIFFKDDGITKGDVIDYYERMSPYILPYLKERPQSLYRTPNGIGEKGFFQKDAGEHAPSFVKSIALHSESSDKDIDYIICNNKATLLYMANLGCIEINPWHSTTKKLDYPDYLIIDIDPSGKNTFDEVVEAAIAVKQVLDRAGATGFCKTSGASGMHVYVPTGKKYTYEQVKNFAHLVCMLVNEKLPSSTTLVRSLKKRSDKKIYLDYLQNSEGQTIASVYSLRPKPGATVSAPLDWSEVKKGLHPSQFTIHNIFERLDKKGDLFEGVLAKPIDLNRCLEKLSD